MKKLVLISISSILIISLMMLFVIPTYSYADVPTEIDPSDWEPPALNSSDVEDLTNAASNIVSYIRVIGVIVTVIALMILGIKYMVGSTEERADYKKSMKPFIIGVIIFFALSQFLAVIIDIADSL